jgi:transposase
MEAKQPFSDQDWQATPEPVRQYIMELEQTIAMLVNKVKQLEKRTEKLENKTNQKTSFC